MILFKSCPTSSPRDLQRIYSQLVVHQDELFYQSLHCSVFRLTIRQSLPNSHHQRLLHSLATPNLDGIVGTTAIHSSVWKYPCRYLANPSSAPVGDYTITVFSNSRLSFAIFTGQQVFIIFVKAAQLMIY
jgi:hypothetical protein